MSRPRDTLLNHDSAAEAAAEAAARGEPLDEVDQLVAEAVRLAKASDDNEPATSAVEALVADTLQLAQGQEAGAGEASGRWLAYGMCTLVTWNLFSNHWNRDSIGALELRLEAPPFALSVRQYNALSASYFAPNVPVPIVAGMLAQSFGPARVYVAFAAVAFIGNLLLGAACVAPHYPLLLAGRALTGFAYEALDLLPMGLLAPRFASSWAMIVGVINGVNRLGSVLSFLLEPVLLHSRGGLAAAIALPALLGASMLPSALGVWRLDARLRRRERGGGVSAPAPAARVPISRRTLRSFSRTYWLFLLGSACSYGCVVPFWFVGAKHLALRWHMSVAEADAYLLWPEGAIALIAPPFGWLLDKQRWGFVRRLVVSAGAISLISLALLALAFLPLEMPPVLGVGVLGVGYAVVQNLIWSTVPLATPPDVLNLSAGLIGCAVNVLPALLPAVAFSGDGPNDLAVLAAVGLVGSAAYVTAACLERARARHGRAGRTGGASDAQRVLPAEEDAQLPAG